MKYYIEIDKKLYWTDSIEIIEWYNVWKYTVTEKETSIFVEWESKIFFEESKEYIEDKQKLYDANKIVQIEIRKLKYDSIQDGATSSTKFDKSLKIEAGKVKDTVRSEAKELQSLFNKKYYWEVYSEEGNKFIQDILIETYASNY